MSDEPNAMARCGNCGSVYHPSHFHSCNTRSPKVLRERITELERELAEAREQAEITKARLQCDLRDAQEQSDARLLRLNAAEQQRDRLAEALKMFKAEGPDSNACFCDAQFAMHGAHPRHTDECIAATEALADVEGGEQ
jgi:hypothetical protein